MKKYFFFLLLAMFIVSSYEILYPRDKDPGILTEAKLEDIETYIKKQNKKVNMPGLAVVIVDNDKAVYKKGFGFADLKNKIPVTEKTLFELGSTSKAFTGLGVLKMVKDGLIDLNDPVSKYIPWLKFMYKGHETDITLEQFFHHTSGIPWKSIGLIPEEDNNGALARTVYDLSGIELASKPGSKYSYATINYDVLAYVIQEISGVLFEDYMTDNILHPLGLNDTYLFREDAGKRGLAKGYKFGFLYPRIYDAPVYRGNTAAGYFMTDLVDLEKWLKIQIGTADIPEDLEELVAMSHIPNRKVQPSYDGSSYAAGWMVYQNGNGEISHAGYNPNFTSFIVMRPSEKIGVAVMANMYTEYTGTIGQGIMDILMDKEPVNRTSDSYQSMDNAAFAIICIMISFLVLTLFFLFAALFELMNKKRFVSINPEKFLKNILMFAILISGLYFCLYNLPNLLFREMPWNAVRVWAPHSIIPAAYLLFGAILVFAMYYTFLTFFPKDEENTYFPLVILSLSSGFGNALIIFTINEVLNTNYGDFKITLFLYFLLAIAIYVYGQRIVRLRMVKLTNFLVYNKRITLIENILKARYNKIESIESGKINAALNNDTEVLSSFANTILNGATCLVTLISCFVYLGIINIYGLFVSILIIISLAAIFFFVGKYANKIYEYSRDIQNVFFNFINDMIHGLKELNINGKKQKDFKDDMVNSCVSYRESRIKAETAFANVFIVGELLFIAAIGSVAFLFPVFFKDLNNSILRTFIFVFIYMTGPLRAILNAIPDVIKMRISWKRINDLINEISSISTDKETPFQIPDNEKLTIELKNISYSYMKEGNESFSLGPIDYSFNSGEIVFITGGNGSGKSTLVKIITGLYSPHEGKILINGNTVGMRNLGENYSTVFSDYYLFNKLYGIDYTGKDELITEYLQKLHLITKVKVKNGIFDTIKLSSGQKKRLALLVSYLEDKPVFLFDEWAADQDPEFRNFFYNELLPELKKRGKCIIAVTHDDRYFDIADKLVKLEMGKMIMTRDNTIKLDEKKSKR